MKRLYNVGLCKECKQIMYVSLTTYTDASDDVKLAIGNAICEILDSGLMIKSFEHDGSITTGSHLPDCSNATKWFMKLFYNNTTKWIYETFLQHVFHRSLSSRHICHRLGQISWRSSGDPKWRAQGEWTETKRSSCCIKHDRVQENWQVCDTAKRRLLIAGHTTGFPGFTKRNLKW